eukprot:1158007-Pyramimonas_sp.AAC.1
MQKRLAKALGRYSGSAPHHAANLGVDFRAGQKQGRGIASSMLRDRHKQLKGRLYRIRAMKRAGAHTLKLYNTGFGQAQLYGTEV